MDWSSFDENYGKLKNVLRDLIRNGKDKHKLDVYESFRNYEPEIKIIVKRIEEETREYINLSKKILEIADTGEDPDDKLVDDFLRHFSLIRLDIKSFFIFTRIFIDTLAKIARLRFGDKWREQLPPTMKDLLKHEKFSTLDPDFAEGFRNKMSWMTTFIETRDEIMHHLGSIQRYTIIEGEFGFRIHGSTFRKNGEFLRTKDMTEILSNLSEVISFIYIKFRFLD